MVIRRGSVWWAELGEPQGSAPGWRRPVLVVQADAFNRSRIGTVVVVVLTSNLRLLEAPGNVLLPARAAGLPRDSVANVSQIITLDRADLDEEAGRLDPRLMRQVEAGMRLVLGAVGRQAVRRTHRTDARFQACHHVRSPSRSRRSAHPMIAPISIGSAPRGAWRWCGSSPVSAGS